MLKILLWLPTSFTKVSEIFTAACKTQMLCLPPAFLTSLLPPLASSALVHAPYSPSGSQLNTHLRPFALAPLSVEKALLQDILLTSPSRFLYIFNEKRTPLYLPILTLYLPTINLILSFCFIFFFTLHIIYSSTY